MKKLLILLVLVILVSAFCTSALAVNCSSCGSPIATTGCQHTLREYRPNQLCATHNAYHTNLWFYNSYMTCCGCGMDYSNAAYAAHLEYFQDPPVDPTPRRVCNY